VNLKHPDLDLDNLDADLDNIGAKLIVAINHFPVEVRRMIFQSWLYQIRALTTMLIIEREARSDRKAS
jgi:hypothetical protein